jgi:hypothetical protein
MKRQYNTGLDTNPISLEVKVGTVGTAYTSVYLARSGGQQTKIAESNVNSGNISLQEIGKAADLKNGYLVILTSIDLSNVDPANWPGATENMVLRYHLSGGFSGDQIYNQDTDDIKVLPKGQILVTKPIQLV